MMTKKIMKVSLLDRCINLMHTLRILKIENGNRVGVLWNPLFWVWLILYALIAPAITGVIIYVKSVYATIKYNVEFSIEQQFITKHNIVTGSAKYVDGKIVKDDRTFTEKVKARMSVSR